MRGVAFGINGSQVTAPDECNWEEKIVGNALSGIQKRSPYRTVTWSKQIVGKCDLNTESHDWFEYENQALSSITLPTYKGRLDDFSTYTRAICKSVAVRNRRGVGNQLTASFWIDPSSAV